MWACGLPYRISPKSENLRFPPCVLSAKAAVGSRPPHTEQGKNQEKPMAMKYALLQHQGLTCFLWFLSKAICLSFAKLSPRAPHFQQKHPKTTSVFFSLKVVPESAESRSFLLDCHRPAPVVRPPRAQDAFAPRA